MNIKEAKTNIKKILDDLNLSIEHRYLQSHLLACLNEINKIEKNKNKKAKIKQQENTNKKIYFSKDALDKIDQMIQEENEKIN